MYIQIGHSGLLRNPPKLFIAAGHTYYSLNQNLPHNFKSGWVDVVLFVQMHGDD